MTDGYYGKILKVDLGTGKTDIFEPDPELYRKYPRHKTTNHKAADTMKKFTDKYMLPNLFKIITTIGKLLPWIGGADRRLRKADVEELRRRIVDFDYMINNFYRLRDLDDKGFPRRARLEKLGLSDMADALEKV